MLGTCSDRGSDICKLALILAAQQLVIAEYTIQTKHNEKWRNVSSQIYNHSYDVTSISLISHI